jgi:hypothetical protein
MPPHDTPLLKHLGAWGEWRGCYGRGGGEKGDAMGPVGEKRGVLWARWGRNWGCYGCGGSAYVQHWPGYGVLRGEGAPCTSTPGPAPSTDLEAKAQDDDTEKGEEQIPRAPPPVSALRHTTCVHQTLREGACQRDALRTSAPPHALTPQSR